VGLGTKARDRGSDKDMSTYIQLGNGQVTFCRQWWSHWRRKQTQQNAETIGLFVWYCMRRTSCSRFCLKELRLKQLQ